MLNFILNYFTFVKTNSMKILYFYPDNPLDMSQGNNARALTLLDYFKKRNVVLDLVGLKSSSYSKDDQKVLEKSELVNKSFLLNDGHSFLNKLVYFFIESLPNLFLNRIRLFRRAKFYHQQQFNSILKSSSYDYVIISYTCWATLVKNNNYLKNATLVIDTHDFLTSQFQLTKKFDLGKFFKTEMELLKMFDYVMAISVEENYIYSQFLKNKVVTVSHSLPNNLNSSIEKRIDILYVASDNIHNRKGIKWFLDFVYPLLSKDLKICIVGKINNHLQDFPNIQKVPFAANLTDYYNSSKIVICPMFSGTGLKIKVIEALSFGIPVVTNERGLDGLFNKTKNGCLVTNNHEKFTGYINELINNEVYYNEISLQAQHYFLENHHTKVVYEKLDTIFNKSI